jgi:HK97 family phage major capsid protein
VEVNEIKDALSGLKSELEKAQAEKFKAVSDNAVKEAKELGERIAELKESAAAQQKHLDELTARQKDIKVGAEKNKSIEEQAYDILKGKEDELKSIKGDKFSKGTNFDIKSAATMTVANYSGGTVGLSQWDNAFALVPRRMPKLRQIVNSFGINEGRYVAWAEQSARDGGAGQTAEGSAKTQADFDIVEANKIVEKITAYTKVSKEALSDIKFLQREINNDLISLVETKLDADLYSGSGTTPAIKGITASGYAPTISLTSTPFATAGGGVPNANHFDVLRAAIYSVEAAFFNPNYIVMHPVDIARIDMLKSTTGEYLQHQAAGQFAFKSYYGLPIISSTVVTAGTFLVGDFTKSNLGIREEINIQVGYDGSDFTNNLVTILAEVRAVHYIKTNHVNAFVKGTFATVIAAMATS